MGRCSILWPHFSRLLPCGHITLPVSHPSHFYWQQHLPERSDSAPARSQRVHAALAGKQSWHITISNPTAGMRQHTKR